MWRFSWTFVLLLVAFRVLGALQVQPAPLGDEFQINTYTTSWQRSPAVAVDAAGDFVVVWESYGSGGTDSDSWSVQGQRYAADGSVLGGEFQVNTYTASHQKSPAVAVESDGDFAVVWQSYASGDWNVWGQRYASSGSVLGVEFQVNTYTTSWQRYPAVTVDSGGDFVVVWQSLGSGDTDSLGTSIHGQRYASDGTVLGVEFQVNTYTTEHQRIPAVAVDAAGDFVVVWESNGSGSTDSSDYSIQGQRYDSNGSLLGGEFQVNTYTMSYQRLPAVAAESGGDFVVVWHSWGSGGTDSSSFSLQGQRYTSDGSVLGGEFQVNTYTTSLQMDSAVAVASGGDFVVVWHSGGSWGTDTSNRSIHGQRYASDGTVLGGEFQVNTYTPIVQSLAAVAAKPDGDFVVVWQSLGSGGSDSDNYSIQGQRYEIPFFFDGFESGDTSAW